MITILHTHTSTKMRIRKLLIALTIAALPLYLTSCAEIPKTPEAQAEAQAANDPLEPMNRVIFDVNDFTDRLLIRPLTELYRFMFPDMMRERVAYIVSNMKEPVIFANNLLQGELSNAGTTFERFAVNTTVGVGGMFDVASGWGLPQQEGDFGQTLSVWGINGGPYLVLPLFGPSNFRDAIGLGVDMVMSPWQYLAAMGGQGMENRVTYSNAAADGLNRREETLEEYDALRAGSLDFYAQMRSLMRQYRDKKLGISNPSYSPAFEDYE